MPIHIAGDEVLVLRLSDTDQVAMERHLQAVGSMERHLPTVELTEIKPQQRLVGLPLPVKGTTSTEGIKPPLRQVPSRDETE